MYWPAERLSASQGLRSMELDIWLQPWVHTGTAIGIFIVRKSKCLNMRVTPKQTAKLLFVVHLTTLSRQLRLNSVEWKDDRWIAVLEMEI
jgi:hypothetical protein